MYSHISSSPRMYIAEDPLHMILSYVYGIWSVQVFFSVLFFFCWYFWYAFFLYGIKNIHIFKKSSILIGVETIISHHFEVFIWTVNDKIVDKIFNWFIDFDIFVIFMSVVPPADHLFVVFVFDDATFSHGRSGSIAWYIFDTLFNIVVILIFFLFGWEEGILVFPLVFSVFFIMEYTGKSIASSTWINNKSIWTKVDN